MIRVIGLFGVVLFTFAASNLHAASAFRSERTIVLRVKTADSKKLLKFSGWYQQGDAEARQEVTGQSAPFGVKMKTNSLRATFHKQSGESEMFVEVIEFFGERENGCITGTGDNLEVAVDSSGDDCRMSVRAVRGR